ncbi:hypothetical protein, partial [Phormidium sp. CCY1219]|uniref:hypothetical protein n=1 Tax=Phormidium sp. CCY1219 TaxID=2886104 RepID=UPI002D1E7D32
MAHQRLHDDTIAENDRALSELAWAIEMSEGSFKLFLARCNYTRMRSQLLRQLQERCAVEIRTLAIAPTATTLYSEIREQLGSDRPQAV